jgi:hypothetical protein
MLRSRMSRGCKSSPPSRRHNVFAQLLAVVFLSDWRCKRMNIRILPLRTERSADVPTYQTVLPRLSCRVLEGRCWLVCKFCSGSAFPCADNSVQGNVMTHSLSVPRSTHVSSVPLHDTPWHSVALILFSFFSSVFKDDFFIMPWSWSNSVSIVSDYRPDDRDSIPGRSKVFFLQLLCPDQLWRPPNLLANGYLGSFLRV